MKSFYNHFVSILAIILVFSLTTKGSDEKRDSLRSALNNVGENEKKVDLLDELIFNLLDYKNSRDSVELLITEALRLSEKLNYTLGKAQILVKKGLLENKDGKFEKSIDTYYEAIRYFTIVKEPGRVLICHLNAGNSYADLGQYEKANVEYKKSLALADSLHERDKMAGIMNNIGTIYYTNGDYPKANSYFVKAVGILEELKDSLKLSSAYANVGIMYYIQQDVANAEKYILKSYNLYKRQSNYAGMGSQLLNLGSLYFENDRDEEALTYFKESLSHFKSVNNVHGIGECYTQLGAAYTKLNQPSTALDFYAKSTKIMEEIGDPRGLAINYQEKSRLNLKLGQYNSAEKDALKSIEIAREMNLPGIKKTNYLTLSEIYEAKGEFKKALRYHKYFIDLKDSLFNEEKHKQVAELEAEYEADKKEKEIALLSKEKALNLLELQKKQANIQRKNTIVIALCAGVVLVVLLVFIIWKRYNDKKTSNILLEKQNHEIARQNKEIKDSIRYAQRIQNAILPPPKLVANYLKQSFILYMPKDIVSGDFYWMHVLPDGNILFAVVDCTGHGVPGAMMSVIGYNHLNQCVNEYQLTNPAAILDKLNMLVSDTLHQHEHHHVQDGMDIALCHLNITSRKLQFSGANNPLYIIRNGELIEKNADRMAIGSATLDDMKKFTDHQLNLEVHDMIYLFSDGYIDQFGGEEGKRFMKKNFKLLLTEIASKTLEEQKKHLLQTFENWKGAGEQLDDLCVIGVRV